MKRSIIVPVFLLLGIVLVCGCINSPPTVTPTLVTTEPTTLPTEVPQVTQTTRAPTTYVPLGSYPITEETTRVVSDNPHLANLQVTKNYFPLTIPNCPMQLAFPEIANDPDYGINQPKPKLQAISAHDYRDFLLDFTEGTGQTTRFINVTKCQGMDGQPEWNFVEVRAILDPTNVKPTNYAISLNVQSKDTVIAEFRTTAQLVIDKQYTILYYIPVKTSETDLFDSVGLTYTRLTS